MFYYKNTYLVTWNCLTLLMFAITISAEIKHKVISVLEKLKLFETYFIVKNTQGGHFSSEWQLCITWCSQLCFRGQGFVHAGTFVPQATGGKMTLAPHSQRSSSNESRAHGLQLPMWHFLSHLCFPQESKRLHVTWHWWSRSIQHSWLHRCLAQERNFVHFFLQRMSLSDVKFLHLICCSILPQRHFTLVVLLHGGQPPRWHLLVQVCGSAKVPHFNIFAQLPLQERIGSRQLFRCPCKMGVLPHGHEVTASGASSQFPQSPSMFKITWIRTQPDLLTKWRTHLNDMAACNDGYRNSTSSRISYRMNKTAWCCFQRCKLLALTLYRRSTQVWRSQYKMNSYRDGTFRDICAIRNSKIYHKPPHNKTPPSGSIDKSLCFYHNRRIFHN